MPKPQNEEIVKELTDKFGKATGVYITDFTGLTVQEAVDFRRKLSAVGVEYRVAKNTLIDLAAKGAKIKGLSDYLVGPTGIALSYDDPASPAKVISDFTKEYEKIEVKACLFEGELFGADKFSEIAKLPSRDELFSRLVGDLQSPMRTLAATLQASMMKLVGVLGSLKNSKQE